MVKWLSIHPKVAAMGIVAGLLYLLGGLEVHGIKIDPTLVSLLAGYLTPSGGAK